MKMVAVLNGSHRQVAIITEERDLPATLDWVDWFNHRPLLTPIGHIPPAEAEETFYAQRDVLDMVA